MDLCLNHPQLGYYSRVDRSGEADPFGTSGDFITSPEVSQIFGELLGVWFLSRWQAAGCSQSIRVVELGPGRGTLMADMLRTFKSIKTCPTDVKAIHLVENSPFMRKLQRAQLSSIVSESQIHWHDRIDEVPKNAQEWTAIVAHEFFDALPVHIFQKTDKGFREVLVDVENSGTQILTPHHAPRTRPLRFVLSPAPTLASQTLISTEHQKLQTGSRIELSPMSPHIATQLTQLLQVQHPSDPGGAGLIVDYGDSHHFGDSLRGFHQHQIVDPLTKPGLTDITTNVDFASLQKAIQPFASTYGPITQREFLLRMGIEVRASRLGQTSEVASACDRLISPLGMGNQYKVLGIETSRLSQLQTEVYPFPPSQL
ncbi:hypothetical protein CROQUDRAFT_44518 [Cronartium quercuum f. sp. fusiforme G11]|uniref:Protein arginine methyltransferase NDUFAF7 n=1 Tax=Cronartium quercuum f. sp. fusiforme G11 TaxID=708437 RepID=A0A9P6NLR6_9BASI|nr:hypothetical protein CROQUDRAFT_44518 [Cronartium quercuum f. sp. fusiforme G11]